MTRQWVHVSPDPSECHLHPNNPSLPHPNALAPSVKSVPDEIASVGWGQVWNTPIRVCVTGAERGKCPVEEPKDCCHDCVRSAALCLNLCLESPPHFWTFFLLQDKKKSFRILKLALFFSVLKCAIFLWRQTCWSLSHTGLSLCDFTTILT